MLNIPTAKANVQARRTAQPAPETGGFGLGTQPASATPMSSAGPGMTSLDATAPTAYAGTTPYEYGGQGWNDPVAQQVTQNYFASTPGYSADTYNQLKGMAEAGSTPGVQYNTPLDPSTWGTVYRGPDYDKLAQDYTAAGGTYYNQFTPAQQAGVPYYAATGEAAPVMNMQTGVAENPLTGQPMNTTGTGSFHTLQPDVMNRMWR